MIKYEQIIPINMKNIIIALVGLIVVVFGWTFIQKQSPSPTVNKEEQIVKIGVLLPLTGSSGVSGEKMYNGIQLAIKEFPPNTKVIVEDTHSKTADAVTAARKLIDIDKVGFIVGPYVTEETLAVAPIAKEKGIVLFTGSFCDDSLKELTNVFCGYPNSDKQLESVVPEIKKNSIKKMALINTNDSFGLSSRNSMKNISPTAGYEIVSDELIQTDANDLKIYATKILKSGADAVFIATANTSQAFNLMKSLYEIGYKGMRITFIDVDTKYLREFGKSADETYAPGIAPNKFSQDFQTKYEKSYSKKAEDYLPALGYDVMRFSFGSYSTKGDKDLVTSALSYDYKNSAIGQFRYLPDRTVLFDMQLWKATDNNYVPVN